MPCLKVDLPPLPTLPAPLTLTPPPLPAIPLPLELCCKIAIDIPLPPLPFPGAPFTINPGIILAINTALATVQTYLDAIVLPCPRE